MKNNIIIGSRESVLAVLQSEMVKSYIENHNPELNVTLLKMKTTGDIILDRTLDKIGGKGLFVKELDRALMDGRSDLSVHSLKDMPMEVPEELPLLAVSKREDPRDVLILPEGVTELDPTKPLGCSSLRRTIQLKRIFPEMEVKSIRGNLQTRLRKLEEEGYAGLILAAAGVKRLGLEHRISRYFTTEEILPAAGQGILAVQGKKGEDYSFLNGYCDSEGWAAGCAERAFVKALDGGCSSPIAAYARIEDEKIILKGMYVREEDQELFFGVKEGTLNESERIGSELAMELKEQAQKGL